MKRQALIIGIVIGIAIMISSLFLLAGCESSGHGYQPPGAGLWKAL